MELETWERDISGDLIAQKGSVTITNSKYDKSLEIIEGQLETIEDEKQRAVAERSIELIKEKMSKNTEVMDIEYTPLLHCELMAISRGHNIGCANQNTEDQYADVCARHCKNPEMTIEKWMSVKKPEQVRAIALFIIDKSIVKSDESDDIKQDFHQLRELVFGTGLTS